MFAKMFEVDEEAFEELPEGLEPELIAVKRIELLEDFFYDILMASSEVDQKYLGQFAKNVESENSFLASMLYKVLGLSILLSKKLIRARRLRKLDTTRDTKSLQLYYHIIWLSREGLVILETYILPSIARYRELKVLAYKLRGSFYHIFVLFHNQPSISKTQIPATAATTVAPAAQQSKGKRPDRTYGSIRASPDVFGNPKSGSLPPGLAPISIPKPSASFLLPATDYIPRASSCFAAAAQLADSLLGGSHPLRLSVKVEYAAYLYDCLHDADASRKLAQQSIRDVYHADDPMDDETFEEAAELVGILGKMMKRGLSSSASGTTSGKQTPSAGGLTPKRRGSSGDPPPLPTPPTTASPKVRSPRARA